MVNNVPQSSLLSALPRLLAWIDRRACFHKYGMGSVVAASAVMVRRTADGFGLRLRHHPVLCCVVVEHVSDDAQFRRNGWQLATGDTVLKVGNSIVPQKGNSHKLMDSMVRAFADSGECARIAFLRYIPEELFNLLSDVRGSLLRLLRLEMFWDKCPPTPDYMRRMAARLRPAYEGMCAAALTVTPTPSRVTAAAAAAITSGCAASVPTASAVAASMAALTNRTPMDAWKRLAAALETEATNMAVAYPHAGDARGPLVRRRRRHGEDAAVSGTPRASPAIGTGIRVDLYAVDEAPETGFAIVMATVVNTTAWFGVGQVLGAVPGAQGRSLSSLVLLPTREPIEGDAIANGTLIYNGTGWSMMTRTVAMVAKGIRLESPDWSSSHAAMLR